MDLYMITLRLIHILAGIFWVGITILFVAFALPWLRKTGRAGDKFILGLSELRLAPAIGTAAVLTVVAGLLMYWRVSAGLNPDWITSRAGLALTAGGVFGILALLTGARVTGPGLDRRIELAREIEAGGGSATPEQQTEVDALHDRMRRTMLFDLGLMVLAVLGMAAHRHL
ncbi:MAG: hypothetical protein ACE5NC_11300 [Anaerolineae bacterium]